jgi:hypothetical protein
VVDVSFFEAFLAGAAVILKLLYKAKGMCPKAHPPFCLFLCVLSVEDFLTQLFTVAFDFLRVSVVDVSFLPRVPIKTALAGFKFRGLAHQHCHSLVEQRTAIGIAQLDIVGTGSKREFLCLLHLVGKSAVHID